MNQMISKDNLDRIILAVDNMTHTEVKALLKSWPTIRFGPF